MKGWGFVTTLRKGSYKGLDSAHMGYQEVTRERLDRYTEYTKVDMSWYKCLQSDFWLVDKAG
jgi:hypothetical protein